MRNEAVVLNQIINFAKTEDRIRGVIMNGSRVNKNAPVDVFQDYDVIMVTNDSSYYLDNQDWMKPFGETAIIQHNINTDYSHIYLMLFKDLVRIDMTFYQVDFLDELEEDSLSLVLLDKDNTLLKFLPPNDSSYFVKKPTKAEFDETINEFFWCLNNVAKGIYREELVYVKFMYEWVVKKPLIKMISWYIGLEYGFKVNPGKFGKWVKKYLPEDMYLLLKDTYSGNDYNEIWESIFKACELMRKVGNPVAEALNYDYPINDDKNTVEYLYQVREMDKVKKYK
ncbi:aminoglycoside 6-adenylyltransferase [Mycoplasmatota bacterium]|nr:aminoglycoside 6-adenylyltransferase [Mycoplasmatota bacterium]